MASAARRVFTSSWSARRVFAHHRPHTSFQQSKPYPPWGRNRIPTPNAFRARSYHGGYNGSSSQNWDGLVYSIMSNIRGEYNFGPECFLSASSSDLNSDSETESTTTPRRDIRALVPLRLNRPWLHVTAEDIQLRLEVLYKAQVHTPDYAAIVAMVKMLERLGTMEEDSPKLELSEYREIFTTVQDGLRADDELYVRIISVKERLVLQQIQFSAECVWRVAVVNAALRSLEGTQISGETSDADAEGGSDYGKGVTFQGDLMALSGKINGLLLDSKDNFPEMEKWFGREEEERILETVVRVMKEAAKRRHM